MLDFFFFFSARDPNFFPSSLFLQRLRIEEGMKKRCDVQIYVSHFFSCRQRTLFTVLAQVYKNCSSGNDASNGQKGENYSGPLSACTNKTDFSVSRGSRVTVAKTGESTLSHHSVLSFAAGLHMIESGATIFFRY